MEDLYKGDSPSKKYARFMYWFRTRENLGEERFYNGLHMVLASREGGDIGALLGWGVAAPNIIAVERNPSAALLVQEKFPEIKVICGEATSIVKEYRRKLSSAYLDFCGTLTDALVADVKQVVLHGLKEEAMLGVTLLTGREKGDVNALLDVEKWMIKKRERDVAESPDHALVKAWAEMSKRKGSYEDMHKEATEALKTPATTKAFAANIRKEHSEGNTIALASVARLNFLHQRLQDELEPFRIVILPLVLLEYTSVTASSKGVPMSTILFRTLRLNKSMPLAKFRHKESSAAFEWGFTNILPCTRDEKQLRRYVVGYYTHMEDTREFDPSRGADRTAALVSHTSKVWNIAPETLIAWKAHYTRGTYDHED